ncbi:MAG: Uma2 family endonuclease [Chloroflexota bacterium]|nr:Uma2 family endonuclease [Chloroflexota bacterium]
MDLQVAERLMTADELLTLDMDDHMKVELVQGVLLTMPPASTKHSMLSQFVAFLIQLHDRDHQLGGRVTGEQGGYLLSSNPDTVRAPDVGYICKVRLGLHREGPYFPAAPDLAVEIVSGESASELQEKIDEYFAHGARLVWAFFPKTRTIHVYTSATNIHILKAGDTLNGGGVLPGFSVPVSDIFAVLEK